MNSISKRQNRIRALVEAALMVALGTILSMIKIDFPWGGGITVVCMLPLVIVGYRHGLKWGLLSSVVFALLQGLLGSDTISAAFLPGDDQMILWKALLMVILDYFLAYALVGLSGLFRNKENPGRSMAKGALLGTSLRFLMHFISGWILWGDYAEWFFTEFDGLVGGGFGAFLLDHFSGQGLAAVYSFVYNGLYMIPEMIFTACFAYLIGQIPQINKTLTERS